jgi:hypothetical protein
MNKIVVKKHVQNLNRLNQVLLVAKIQGTTTRTNENHIKTNILFYLSSSDEENNNLNTIINNKNRSKSIIKDEIFRGLKITGLPSRNISMYQK